MGSYWSGNAEAVTRLNARMGRAAWSVDHAFVAGSMFWVRLNALRNLLDTPLRCCDFEPEQGQLDGTLAHAIERIFTITALQSGYTMSDAATVCGAASSKGSAPYRYANPT